VLGDQTVANNVTCMDSDTSDNYYVGGFTTSKLVTDTSKSSSNGYVIAFNSDDTIKWSRQIIPEKKD